MKKLHFQSIFNDILSKYTNFICHIGNKSFILLNKFLLLFLPNMRISQKIILFAVFTYLFFYVACNNNSEVKKEQSPYLNLHDSVFYVGIEVCKNCHMNVYNTFIENGMGQSFGLATKQKSKAIFDQHALVYDKDLDFYYKPFWRNDSLFFMEFRLQNKDTIYKRIEHIKYIIGSGQHTNSHMVDFNGYIYQAPMTFYTQKSTWDLPPGFENGHNSRFSRKIGLECMTCHNGMPEFEKGSENKYLKVLHGINCERCHGPGSLHVTEKMKGNIIDTSKYIDYTIVNPKDLTQDLQMSLCQRCHLQGIAVLQYGKNFDDFRPGMQLGSVMDIFLPRYKNDKEFIMASQADRLRQSKCYINSKSISCITCHNPHFSVKNEPVAHFNNTCKNCHSGSEKVICSEEKSVRELSQNNCVGCHMPHSGSIDIPHISITDHRIQVPIKEDKKEAIQEFVRLQCMTDENPISLKMAEGYLAFYEKFSQQNAFLDSAIKYAENAKEDTPLWVHIYYLQEAYVAITQLVEKNNNIEITDGWTNYRIGEAYYQNGSMNKAEYNFQLAVRYKPYNLDFRNKLGSIYAAKGDWQEAKNIFEWILKENPNFHAAWSNVGFVYLNLGNQEKAVECYQKSLALDPDYEPALMNMVGIYLIKKELYSAQKLLNNILTKYPENRKAREILSSIRGM